MAVDGRTERTRNVNIGQNRTRIAPQIGCLNVLEYPREANMSY